MPSIEFLVARSDLRQVRIVEDADRPALAEGEARLRIDAFALTANNVTYGAFGEAMHYWDFFPTGRDGWGSIPVWGYADVVESRAQGLAPGERCYGYFPMRSEVVLRPVRADAAGFVDGAAHRRELPAVYNHYARCRSDPAYRPEAQAETALLRPLFITSFLIDDFLADNAFFGAATVLLSSASSKTAYGCAFFLSQRRGEVDAPRVVGLTSARHLAWVQRLGCYDEVHGYDALETLDATAPAVYVDMSGSAALRARVHAHFGARLAYSCSVGGTHWSELGSGKGLPGPRPVLFFAPAQIRKRASEWGGEALQQRIDAGWAAALERVRDPRRPWLEVRRGRGPAQVEAAYRALVDGTAEPRQGWFLSL
jgi:hypothetical protein